MIFELQLKYDKKALKIYNELSSQDMDRVKDQVREMAQSYKEVLRREKGSDKQEQHGFESPEEKVVFSAEEEDQDENEWTSNEMIWRL